MATGTLRLPLDVDALVRLAQRTTATSGTKRERLGKNRDRRLCGALRTHVQARRPTQSVELFGGHACFEQLLPPARLGDAAAEGPDVEGVESVAR